jgi:drug/metabolite transporter (DMT)-like permease
MTNAQAYLRIPIGVGLSVALLGETIPPNLVLGLVLVVAGVAAMTVPDGGYRRRIDPPGSGRPRTKAN